MTKNDGGQAFPVTGHNGVAAYGMSLRDWFATHAPVPSEERISVLLKMDQGRNPHNEPHKPYIRTRCEIIACLAYEYADAMIKARGE